MKKILIKLVVIAGVLFVADRAFSWIFSKVVFSKIYSGESGGSVNYLLQKKKGEDFIILGSSRAKFHINPSLLTHFYDGNGYNAGISGTGGLIYNDALLRLMVSEGVKPKAIIQQVDVYPYFTIKEENAANELLQLYPFIGNNEVLKDYIYSHAGFAERFKLFFHSYKYNGKILNLLFNYTKRNSFKNNNGFEGLVSKYDTTGFHLPAGIEETADYSQTKLDALKNIVNTCKTNNIPISIVISPSWNNGNYSKKGTAKIIGMLREIGVTDIYDFSDIEKFPSLQPSSIWKNVSHFNSQGAAIFSSMLNDSIAAHHPAAIK